MSKSNAQCDGMRSVAFGKWLGHEGTALVNEISNLRKRNPRELVPFPPPSAVTTE